MSDEFHRKSEMENLAQIPVVIEILQRVETSVSKLEVSVNNEIVNNARYKQDVSWLKKFFWLIAGGAISGLAISIFNLISK